MAKISIPPGSPTVGGIKLVLLRGSLKRLEYAFGVQQNRVIPSVLGTRVSFTFLDTAPPGGREYIWAMVCE